MREGKCIAMLLAGGQGSRLGVLTRKLAKPAVPFGGKYRIIDFTLSNCINSGIETVGVLTQYQPLELNAYIGNGQPWDLDRLHGGVAVLPPYTTSNKEQWYKGTANAIYQNIHFLERFSPTYVLVLSGDHIYKMDYAKMLFHHTQRQADVTIATIDVPIEEASRFGMMNANADGEIYEFEEKPKKPKSTKASMGIYIFNWDILKRYLVEDESNTSSSHDFGKNIIPAMLSDGQKLIAYDFEGYWKDVGTIKSYWEANMDLIGPAAVFNLYDNAWRIYARNPGVPPNFIATGSNVVRSMITEGSIIYGNVDSSIIFHSVYIGKNSSVKNSIIMPGVHIEDHVNIEYSIIAENAHIGCGCQVGSNPADMPDAMRKGITEGITVVGDGLHLPDHFKVTGEEIY